MSVPRSSPGSVASSRYSVRSASYQPSTGALQGVANSLRRELQPKAARKRFTKYHNVFDGSTAVRSMIALGMCRTASEAVRLGQDLAETGYIHSVKGVGHRFKDTASSLYRFKEWGGAGPNGEVPVPRLEPGTRHSMARSFSGLSVASTASARSSVADALEPDAVRFRDFSPEERGARAVRRTSPSDSQPTRRGETRPAPPRPAGVPTGAAGPGRPLASVSPARGIASNYGVSPGGQAGSSAARAVRAAPSLTALAASLAEASAAAVDNAVIVPRDSLLGMILQWLAIEVIGDAVVAEAAPADVAVVMLRLLLVLGAAHAFCAQVLALPAALLAGDFVAALSAAAMAALVFAGILAAFLSSQTWRAATDPNSLTQQALRAAAAQEARPSPASSATRGEGRPPRPGSARRVLAADSTGSGATSALAGASPAQPAESSATQTPTRPPSTALASPPVLNLSDVMSALQEDTLRQRVAADVE